jgi:hypothetical protein
MAARKTRAKTLRPDTTKEQIADLEQQVRLLTDIKTSLYKSIDHHELTEVALRETVEVQKATITALEARLQKQAEIEDYLRRTLARGRSHEHVSSDVHADERGSETLPVMSLKEKQCWSYTREGKPTLYVYSDTREGAIGTLENHGVVVQVKNLAKCAGPNPSVSEDKRKAPGA